MLIWLPSWCSKYPVTPEPSLEKDECQWQEESQADPWLMRQPLDVGGKSEFLGGLQEAWADDRVCVCPPGLDTPENTLCSRVDDQPALAVVTPGGGAGGESVHYVRLPSGRGHIVTPWIKGCNLSRLVCGLPYVFFSYLSLIYFGTLT